jgi:hypothetical protein
VAGFRCTRFEVLGGLVIILRETSDHAFQITLPCHLGQSPKMVRALAVIRCTVHTLQNSAVRKTIPQPNLAVIAIALFRDPMEREARLPVSAA